MSDDLLITPGSRKMEFKDSSANIDAKIETDASGNLKITNAGGDIEIGDTSSDVFIGDGTNNIDIVFEQSGEIRGTSGVTLTLGASGSNVAMATDLSLGGNDLTNVGNLTMSGNLTVSGTTTTVSSTNTTIADSIIELNSGLTGANSKDIGFIFERGSTGNNAGFVWDESADRFTVILTTDTASSDTVDTSSVANFQAGSFYGNGANLTSLNASNLSSGTIPTARIGVVDLGSGTNSVKKTAGGSNGNHAAIELFASGTGDEGSAIAIQQQTSEGDTIIFADYEPHVEWGISAENNSNEIHFNAGSSTGSLGTKTFRNNAGTARTAYKKVVISLSSGNIQWGGTATGNGSGITTLNASNLSSGTVPDARIAASSITQHTDSKYLRSNATDTATGLITLGNGVIITKASSDQSTSQDSASVPDTTGAEIVKFQGGYTNGQYTTEFAKVDRSGNLPLYVRQSKGTANSFSNIARFGDHGQSNGTDLFAVFGNARVNGRVTAQDLTLSSLSAQNSEATALMINGSNVVGTRELGSNAFNSTSFLTGNQTITLSGDVSGSGTTSISVAITDDSHNHHRLDSTDDRDMKPSTSGIAGSVQAIKPFFSSFGGMTGSANTTYVDVLAFDTYSDSSGGGPSAITFHKGQSAGDPKMYIWHAGWNATTWSTGQRVFADNYHPNADTLTTARTIAGTSFNGSANIDISYNNLTNKPTIPTNNNQLTNGAGYITSASFNGLTGKTSGTGTYSTSSHLQSGRGSGGVAMTINDGYGNANLTFNHLSGVPEQNGNSARIEVNTDGTSDAHMSFEVKSNVTNGSAVQTATGMQVRESYVDIPQYLRHIGDSDTYIRFTDNRVRIVAGNSTAFDSNNDYLINTSGLNASNLSSGTVPDARIAASSITQHTDSKYLRSNAADTATGQIFFDAGFDAHPIMLSGTVNMDNVDRSGFYNLYNINSGSTGYAGFPYGTMIAIGNDKGSQGFGLQIAHERTNTQFKVRGMNDTGSAWSSWATIWTSAIDGSGSGLDADLLDGVHGSSFLRSDAADTAGSAITFSGGQTWNSDITWNNAKNILVAGESSFDVSGSGVWQVWDAGTGAPFIMCDVGSRTEIGSAGTRGLKVHGEMECNDADVNGIVIQGPGSNVYNYASHFSASGASIQLSFGRTDSSTGTGAIGADSTNCFAAWNTSSTARRFEVRHGGDAHFAGDLYMPDKLRHVGDTNSYIQFHANDQFRVVTSGTERFEINSSGVSLGNSSNRIPLAFANVSAIASTSDTLTIGDVDENDDYSNVIIQTMAGNGKLTVGDGEIFMYGTQNSNAEFKFTSNGILHADNDVIAFSSTISSDRKLKENIQPIEGGLNKILKLKGVSFDWKDEKRDKNQLGFIAQDVEEILPELVKEVETLGTEDETHKVVNYDGVIPVLVEAIKMQQKQIDRLSKLLEGKE